MVRNDAAAMAGWLEEASGSEMAAFARGRTADLDAVMVALREPWSNGQTEGQINRLKMLKRQIYGAAGIAGAWLLCRCGLKRGVTGMETVAGLVVSETTARTHPGSMDGLSMRLR
ncbi:hypothetical protein [Paracoccus aminovorans]|uniref:hypothetical protein n=1 Tax=Paracoccus aminovorans TaxID=34004 RepID=UPI000A6F64FD|nr:hypothetical protein [Paracoccus aminovorans]